MALTYPSVLVTCGGKWVGLILHLRRAMAELAQMNGGRILVADATELTPAGTFADRSFVVPPIWSDDYVETLLEICRTESVRVLVPHIDIDLEKLAPHAERFAAVGTMVVCPKPEVVAICTDKLEFARFSSEAGLAHPATMTIEQVREDMFPLFAKRRFGYGSIGAGLCLSMEEARTRLEGMRDLIFQQPLEGPELTVDAFVSRSGECTVCVQRVRDKVLGGEAMQSHTVKWPETGKLASDTIEALAAAGLRGPLNLQMMGRDKPQLIEVNPRLGSACLLSNAACGGRLFRSVLLESCGITCTGDPDDYIDNLSLYRYFGEVFYSGAAVLDFPGNVQTDAQEAVGLIEE